MAPPRKQRRATVHRRSPLDTLQALVVPADASLVLFAQGGLNPADMREMGQVLAQAGLLGRTVMLAGDAGGWAGGVIPTDQLHQLLADHPDLLASLNETVGEQVPAPLVCSRCGQTITGPPYFQPHDGPPHHLDGGCPTEGATSGEG